MGATSQVVPISTFLKGRFLYGAYEAERTQKIKTRP